MDDSGQFRIEVVGDVDLQCINLVGELDLAVSEEAWDSLRAMVTPGENLVLDVSHVTFIDSRGLNVLVRVIKALKGGNLVLRNPSIGVTRLFEISGLMGLVTFE